MKIVPVNELLDPCPDCGNDVRDIDRRCVPAPAREAAPPWWDRVWVVVCTLCKRQTVRPPNSLRECGWCEGSLAGV